MTPIIDEDRNEPKVEVYGDQETRPIPPVFQRPGPSWPLKKIGIGVLVVLGLAGTGYGLWSGLGRGRPVAEQVPNSTEIAILKSEILQLRIEVQTIQKDLQTLKEGQKTLPDQVKGLQEPINRPKEPLLIPAAQKDSPRVAKPAPKTLTYKIKRGDSLSSVAKKFRVTSNDLLRWNRLPRNSKLKTGQILILHPPIP
ncbi:MAG: LysM peptidoglycan-binding domain-containing protein [Thermodesulfobacteriota bacterium]